MTWAETKGTEISPNNMQIIFFIYTNIQTQSLSSFLKCKIMQKDEEISREGVLNRLTYQPIEDTL